MLLASLVPLQPCDPEVSLSLCLSVAKSVLYQNSLPLGRNPAMCSGQPHLCVCRNQPAASGSRPISPTSHSFLVPVPLFARLLLQRMTVAISRAAPCLCLPGEEFTATSPGHPALSGSPEEHMHLCPASSKHGVGLQNCWPHCYRLNDGPQTCHQNQGLCSLTW